MPLVDLSTSSDIVLKARLPSLQGDRGLAFKNLCLERFTEKPRDIHLDFSTVKYMDSSAIGAMLFITQHLKQHERKVYLDAATPELKELFRTLIMDQYIVM